MAPDVVNAPTVGVADVSLRRIRDVGVVVEVEVEVEAVVGGEVAGEVAIDE